MTSPYNDYMIEVANNQVDYVAAEDAAAIETVVPREKRGCLHKYHNWFTGAGICLNVIAVITALIPIAMILYSVLTTNVIADNIVVIVSSACITMSAVLIIISMQMLYISTLYSV